MQRRAFVYSIVKYRSLPAVLMMTAGAAALWGADALSAVMSRVDQGAAAFQTLNASVEWVDHTKILNEDSRQAGTVRLKKSRNSVLGWIGFTEPDAKTVALGGGNVEIFYPKMKTVQIWELGKNGSQFYQFLLLGFGTSAAELNKHYSVRVGGAEPAGGQPATRLELTPKGKQVAEYLSRIELWIPDNSPYPVQERLHHKSGDTTTIRYSNMQINSPLADKQLALELPPGVKKEYPQK